MKRQTTQDLYFLIDDGDNRQQRATTLLRNVGYVIEAHFQLTEQAGDDDSVGKHLDIFNRRARKGQYFHQPYFGNRELPAHFSLIESDQDLPESELSKASKDLGWMLHDIDFANDCTPRFFRAAMKNGVIEMPSFEASEVVQ